jgi:hypothetical protein
VIISDGGNIGSASDTDAIAIAADGSVTLTVQQIADNHVLTVDDADAADNDYARFTANGLEGRSYAEVLADLSGEADATFSFNGQSVEGVAGFTVVATGDAFSLTRQSASNAATRRLVEYIYDQTTGAQDGDGLYLDYSIDDDGGTSGVFARMSVIATDVSAGASRKAAITWNVRSGNSLNEAIRIDEGGHLLIGTDTSSTHGEPLHVNGGIGGLEKSADPAEPAEGEFVIWMSDGTGKGDDGDVMIASKAGGTTKYGTLFDHSAGSAW